MVAFQLLIDCAGSYVFGLTLPAGHYTSDVAWPTIRTDEKTGQKMIDGEWAKLQVESTKDYAVHSPYFKHCFGHINNHAVHHLFPGLHYMHYEEIYPIVKQVCKEFNVKSPDVGTYSELLHDYFFNLYHMGYDPKLLM